MSSGKTNPTQDSRTAHASEDSLGKLSGAPRSAPKIDLESMHPLERARLDAAVMMLVDFLISASV